MLNIAVLVSGGGTNLQALLDSEARGENPNGKITLVVASKPGVFALERAAKAGVEGCVVRRKDYAASEEFDAALLETLRAHKIDLVVLAGFLSVLGPSVIAAYPRRILNVHPALIPSFCGPGMYGLRPHEAALARGCKVTGATVHFVNEECDGGPILLQKAVDILPGDTPEVLQKRVMEQAEWKLLPKAVAMVCSGFASSSPKGRALGKTMNFVWTAKASHFGGGGSASALTERARSLSVKENNNGKDQPERVSGRQRVPRPRHCGGNGTGRTADVYRLLYHGTQREQPQPRV